MRKVAIKRQHTQTVHIKYKNKIWEN